MEVGIRQAKIDLSKLIKSVLQGERVIITNHGKPLVELVPAPRKGRSANRGYGSLKNVLHLPPGWDSPQAGEELLNRFEFIQEKRALEAAK
jgi:prevent-host-death family protein